MRRGPHDIEAGPALALADKLESLGIDPSRPFLCTIDRTAWAIIAEQER